jgi:hypothetical protein
MVTEAETINGIACTAVEGRRDPQRTMIVGPEQHIELYLEDFDFCPHITPKRGQVLIDDSSEIGCRGGHEGVLNGGQSIRFSKPLTATFHGKFARPFGTDPAVG